jgi:TonB-dependent SusC/RagA subfamily outer membrane receptor
MNKINQFNKLSVSIGSFFFTQLLIALFFAGAISAKNPTPPILNNALHKGNRVVHYVAFKIKGRIIDETGEGLIGANILVKGTGKGTTADADGNFELEVPNAQAVLVISFVGYDKQEITVGTQTFINVSLKPQKALEEVVVVGFAVQKKISVTGAVSSVSTKELIQSPVANLSNSLVGRMAGLFAVQGSGEPGSDASTLRIRGVSTFAGGTSSNPLIMVDGIEVSNYNNIDPNEIESVTILKDASATAVYGIRGANGVLIITTKRGTIGKPQLSYSSNIAITGFTDLRKGMDSYTYTKSFNHNFQMKILKNIKQVLIQLFTQVQTGIQLF